MTVFDWHSLLRPAGAAFDLVFPFTRYIDPRTRRDLRQRRSQPYWTATLDFHNLTTDKQRLLYSRLVKLEDSLHTARFWDYGDPGTLTSQWYDDGEGYDDGLGWADGVMTVHKAAAAAAVSFVIHCNEGPPEVIKAGTKVGLPNDRLYVVVDDATFDESNNARVWVKPYLWDAISAGDEVKVWRAPAVFVLSERPPVARGVEKISSVSLSFTEEMRP